ncbi:lipid A deacylase LpxR family protein [Microbulbifer sp. 2304DJ12-6]|uniref:lipid A deacylase LpxR family protein n=1 Tax=Microbulbifer sp. 2304DJ12-6 TaxID=3233340 RepID=UPI0039AF554D
MIRFLLSVLSTCLLFYSLYNHANDEQSANLWSYNWENDFWVNDDGGYTNGFSYTWGYSIGKEGFSDENIPSWIHRITRDTPIATVKNKQRAMSFKIMQEMYTPDHTSRKEVNTEDRPYAGLLYWQGNMFAGSHYINDRLSLLLGFVGPPSLAKQSQKAAHSLIGANPPKGWKNQINTEPIFRLEAERVWRLGSITLGGDHEMDFITLVQGGVGNRKTDFGLGFGWRIGSGLANSFLNTSVNPATNMNPAMLPKHGDWHLFITCMGTYVINDITLNGNTFSNSHSVKLQRKLHIATAGGAIQLYRFTVNFTLSAVSEAFDVQQGTNQYGSLALTYRW